MLRLSRICSTNAPNSVRLTVERELNRDNFQGVGERFRLIELNKVIAEVDVALGSFCATLYASGSGTTTLGSP